MAYGFVITTGDADLRLSERLFNLIAEVRVEQDMSKPTKFAVRFEEDICDGDRQALSATEIEPGTKVAVLVPGSDDSLVCLVQGQVTKFKSSAVTGGPGSWLEIHGEDLRAALSRETVTATWAGTAAGIAESVFAMHAIESEVKDCETPAFGTEEGQRTHNQSGPDLQLLEALARMLGYEFWFSYTATASPTGSFVIEPKAMFKPSPDYDTAGGGVTFPVPSIDLLGPGEVKTLRLDVAEGCCRTVTSFRIDVDVEKATMAVVNGHDDLNGEEDSSETADPRTPSDPSATRRPEFFHCQRTISDPGAGSAAERADENRAVIAEEGWFVTAAASTSAHLMEGVVQAHDIVAVEGNGFVHSGRYHVSKVVHVVNGWGHLMDLSLRRNALPEAAYA